MAGKRQEAMAQVESLLNADPVLQDLQRRYGDQLRTRGAGGGFPHGGNPLVRQIMDRQVDVLQAAGVKIPRDAKVGVITNDVSNKSFVQRNSDWLVPAFSAFVAAAFVPGLIPGGPAASAPSASAATAAGGIPGAVTTGGALKNGVGWGPSIAQGLNNAASADGGMPDWLEKLLGGVGRGVGNNLGPLLTGLIPLLGRMGSGGGGPISPVPINVQAPQAPPELTELLKLSMSRMKSQEPLFNSVNAQAMAGLPDYAKRG